MSLSAAAAAAAAVFGGTHISFGSSGGLEVSGPVSYFTVINNPTQAQIRKIASTQDYPVILPSGLPVGATLFQAAILGPGAFGISYNMPGSWRVSNHVMRVIIANRSDIGGASRAHDTHDRYTLHTGEVQAHWTVGQEEVTVLGTAATPQEIAHIKRAMLLDHK